MEKGHQTTRRKQKNPTMHEKLEVEDGRKRASSLANVRGVRHDEHVQGEVLDEDVSEKILRELRDFRRDNAEQLKDIKDDIKNITDRLGHAEERIDGTESRIQSTEEVVVEMLKLQTQLEARITDQESRSRRENIQIFGVKEGAEGSPADMIPFVERMLREKLGVEPSQPIQIERAHRALAPRPPEDAPPRSIIVKFLSYRTKEDILRLAWQKKGFLWMDRRVNIDHDYAPRVLRQRKDFTEAKKMLKERDIRFQTPFPARLRVFYPDETRLYDTAEEATKDMAERGIPVAVVRPPETLIEQVRKLTWQTVERPRGRERTRKKPDYREKLLAYKRPNPRD